MASPGRTVLFGGLSSLMVSVFLVPSGCSARGGYRAEGLYSLVGSGGIEDSDARGSVVPKTSVGLKVSRLLNGSLKSPTSSSPIPLE